MSMNPEEYGASFDQRVADMVADAWQRVPGFRRRLERDGVAPDQVHGATDLERIAVVT